MKATIISESRCGKKRMVVVKGKGRSFTRHIVKVGSAWFDKRGNQYDGETVTHRDDLKQAA